MCYQLWISDQTIIWEDKTFPDLYPSSNFISSYTEANVTAWRLPGISTRKETMFALLTHLSSTWQKMGHIYLTPQRFATLIEWTNRCLVPSYFFIWPFALPLIHKCYFSSLNHTHNLRTSPTTIQILCLVRIFWPLCNIRSHLVQNYSSFPLIWDLYLALYAP